MNGIKTFLLIMAMTALLVFIGDALYGQSGVVLALGLSIILNGVSYFFSDRIVLAAYRAQLVTPAQAPRWPRPSVQAKATERMRVGKQIAV